ncbi:MAG: protein-tyrosine-phosphatase [Ekhidna sp.]|uniref:arsenate-mycothiol transferase ArsC n=1 Tax=Ekhidna sp. TaxID=2608089 RepID=UPI0032EDF432
MNKKLKQYISSLGHTELDEPRKAILADLINYIQGRSGAKLNFICTHNSRRSHLSQVWAQTMAAYFGVKVETFSGGTEATAFHPNAVASLERAGFTIKGGDGKNPQYKVQFDASIEPIICYSKTFDDPANPASGFAAIMTCSEADADCPLVLGADARIKLFYEDPKVSDGTPGETKTYDERCRQIAAEMYFVFSQIKT